MTKQEQANTQEVKARTRLLNAQAEQLELQNAKAKVS